MGHIFLDEDVCGDYTLVSTFTSASGQRLLHSKAHPRITPISSLTTISRRLTPEDLYYGNQWFIYGGHESSNIDHHVQIDEQSEKMQVSTYERLIAYMYLSGPPFFLFNCSDSSERDLSTKSILSFAVEQLGVYHIIVMGHYSCGGVGAALTPPSKDANPISTADMTIHEYISPIRRIYQTSERAEIASYHEARTTLPTHSPEDHDYSWITYNEDKALVRVAHAFVEENVKAQALRITTITTSELMVEFASESTNIYIHGFVYEVAAGQVYDLSVSVGPPGASLPHMRFLPVGPNIP